MVLAWSKNFQLRGWSNNSIAITFHKLVRSTSQAYQRISRLHRAILRRNIATAVLNQCISELDIMIVVAMSLSRSNAIHDTAFPIFRYFYRATRVSRDAHIFSLLLIASKTRIYVYKAN